MSLRGTLIARSPKDRRGGRDRIDVNVVLASADLARIITNDRGSPDRSRNWLCPFHDDHHPSLGLTKDGRRFRCWSCGAAGSALDWFMRRENLSFLDAVAKIDPSFLAPGRRPGRATSPAGRLPASTTTRPPAEPSGLSESVALTLVDEAADRLWTPEGADALAYLTGPRCLSPETIRAARLGWVTAGTTGIPWNAPGVVIPWFVGLRLALVKVRPPDAWRDRFPEGKRPPKYLEVFRDPARLVCYPTPEAIRPGDPLIVTEGEFDALTLGESLGKLAAVVTLGSASTTPTPVILRRFLTADPWFIATDADQAGDKAADQWTARAHRVRPPGSFKDWTEAKAAEVDLTRWWRDKLNGNDRPPLFSWDELARQRWGGSTEEDEPIIMDQTDRQRALEAVALAVVDPDDPEREAIRVQ